MPLVTDRDLLVMEPAVFTTASSAARVLAWSNRASVSDTTATFEDLDLEEFDITAGHVMVIEGAAIEIVSRTSSSECEVSLPRPTTAGEKVAPGNHEQVHADVLSFAALIDDVESALLRTLGIDPAHPVQPLTVEAITNPESIQRLIALRVLAEAFAAAAAGAPEDAALAARRDHYTTRAAKALHTTHCLIDLDGDGVPDVTRFPGVIPFTRA